ncbi:hypothetical protein Tco_0029399, partial [Tanacetum coccineum]
LEIGKCNGRLNPGKTQREPTFQVVLGALALTPCYSAFLTTADVLEVYMHQFWDSIHKHDTSYRFRMDKKKKFYLNLETFRDIFQICPRVHGQDFDELLTNEVNVSFFKELGHTRKSSQSLMLLFIRCINLGEPLLLSSTKVYLERQTVLTSFVSLEHKSFRECTIRRMWTMLNCFGKISLTRLTTKLTKSKRRCTTLDLLKLSFTTSLSKTRQSLGETSLKMREMKAYKTYLGYATGATPPKIARKFKKAHPSKKDINMNLVLVDEEPKSAKKKKEKVTVDQGKGIVLLSKVALTEEA